MSVLSGTVKESWLLRSEVAEVGGDGPTVDLRRDSLKCVCGRWWWWFGWGGGGLLGGIVSVFKIK